MKLLQCTATAALVAAGLALGASAAAGTNAAQAAPAAVSAASSHALTTDSQIVQVRDGRRYGGDWDGRRYHRRGYYNDGWNPGAYIGLGIAGALIGGALSEGEYDDGPGYASGGYGEGSGVAMQRCAATFRSFEWDTGLYTTYQGDKRLCPYLG